MRRPSRPSGAPLVLTGAVITLFAAALCLRPPPLADFFEGKIYDSFLRSAHRAPAGGSVTIVDLDEASLAALGQWPWPRYRVARLLDRIRESGAAAIGIDTVFAEPDRISLMALSREIRRDLDAGIGLAGIPREALDTDAALAAAVSKGPFVLGYQFDFDAARGESCVLHPLRAAVRSVGEGNREPAFFEAPGVVCNLQSLSIAAGSSGFFNVTPDTDGVLRRVPMVIRYKGLLYPSLALAAVLRARNGDVVLETGLDGVEAIRIDERRIPLDGRGNLLLNYRGRRRTFPHVPAAAVLSGTADRKMLAGRIVLLGTTATGLHEIRTTPLEAAQPGVEIHATAIDNLMAGDAISRFRFARLLQVILVLVPGFLLTVLIARARAFWGFVTIVPAVACIWLGSYWLLSHRQIFFPPLMPVATLGALFTVLTSLRFIQADREMRARTRKLALTQDAIIQSLA
ncbi:MAG TPA: CHASE2 domain-containing protein, partial [Candidatus Deferrimicrobiaceae bacterium]